MRVADIGPAHDIFAGSYALLVLTSVAAPAAPPIELMRSLFDLTASEARVARGLPSARRWMRPPQAAGSPCPPFARSCARFWKKTGCARQAEVVSLLANVTLDRNTAKN